MNVIVRGKNVPVHSKLRSVAQQKLSKLDRYASGAQRAEVRFAEQRNPRIADHHVCTVTVHLRHGTVTAHAAAPAPEAALDRVIEKLKQQATRRKDRFVSRTHHPRNNPRAVAPS